METVSPWTVYWILQLDSIGASLSVLSIGGLLAASLLTIFGAMNKSFSNSYPEHISSKRERASGEAMHRLARILAAIVIPLFLINSLLPSTKSMAAIIVVPAIANSEMIRSEAGDLYDLAKQALAKAVAPEEKAPDKEAR